MGAYDGYQYAKKKGLTGWKKGAAIVGGALLGAVNPFKIVGKAGKAAKAVKAIKTAKKAKKTTKAIKAVTNTPKKTVVTKKVTKVATAGNKTIKTTGVVKTDLKKISVKTKPVIYWESRDRKEDVSLIEIGINENTGKIQNIALTAAQGYENKLLDIKESVLVQGDPLVELKEIDNNIVDSIDVFLSKRKIEITLCDVKHIKK